MLKVISARADLISLAAVLAAPLVGIGLFILTNGG
jgi:hypothetical protein